VPLRSRLWSSSDPPNVCKLSILRGFLPIVVRTGFYDQTMLEFPQSRGLARGQRQSSLSRRVRSLEDQLVRLFDRTSGSVSADARRPAVLCSFVDEANSCKVGVLLLVFDDPAPISNLAIDECGVSRRCPAHWLSAESLEARPIDGVERAGTADQRSPSLS
jgi:hypothetical protein